jgi:hypothetical protein
VVSESDKLKDDAEQLARQHPQQVSEGKTEIEKKLGMDSEQDETSQLDPNTPPQGTDKAGQQQGS